MNDHDNARQAMAQLMLALRKLDEVTLQAELDLIDDDIALLRREHGLDGFVMPNTFAPSGGSVCLVSWVGAEAGGNGGVSVWGAGGSGGNGGSAMAAVAPNAVNYPTGRQPNPDGPMADSMMTMIAVRGYMADHFPLRWLRYGNGPVVRVECRVRETRVTLAPFWLFGYERRRMEAYLKDLVPAGVEVTLVVARRAS